MSFCYGSFSIPAYRKTVDIFLTVVVKGEPIISDATMEDAEELKFDEVCDEILTTGCFAIGLDFNKLPTQLKKSIDQADLILCKGMANYEAFSETNYRPVGYLLRTKCTAISKSMELPLKTADTVRFVSLAILQLLKT